MDTETQEPSSLSIDFSESRRALPLRRRLRHNAAFSAIAGTTATIGSAPTAAALGLGRSWLVLVVGISLLSFSASVYLVSRLAERSLLRFALEVSLADFVWVAGTAALVVLGLFSPAGNAIMVTQGAVVAWFGITQVDRRRKLRP